MLFVINIFLCLIPCIISIHSLPSTVQRLLQNKGSLQRVSYNELITQIDNDELSAVFFTNNLDEVVSESIKEPSEYSITTMHPLLANRIVDESIKHNVEPVFLQLVHPNLFQSAAGSILQFADGYVFPILVLTFIISLVRAAASTIGMPGMPGSNDINSDKINMVKANITLSSFAGSPEIFEECTEVVSYLKNDTIYKLAGAEIPRGILLEGPPGTGKTLLAKAIASEAEANFISVTASEFVELFVGMGAAKVRALFKKARDNTPCIIFIDEIDAVGKQRGAGVNFGNDEREQTLNQLLAEMDGFADNEGILIIAATNRKDVLDAALLRPGRFDRIVQVPLPNRESRKEIFKVHSKNKQVNETINMELVSQMTDGFSGAQIKNVLNEAAIFTSRRNETMIQEVDLFNAVDKLIVGLPKRVDDRSYESKRRVAIHETGHALLAAIFDEYFELKKVTMQSTYSGAGGYTIFNEYSNITESGLYTKDLLWKRLLIGMGGKAAESIYYGDDFVSVGAIQDLKTTNSLAQRMIGNYGMGNKLEAFYNENVDADRNPFLGRSMGSSDKYSEKTKELFDKECLSLVTSAYQDAKKILFENKDKMDMIVEELMNKYTLYGKDVYTLLQ